MKNRLKLSCLTLKVMVSAFIAFALFSCEKNEIYSEDCAGILTCRFQLQDGRVFDCSVDQVNGVISNDKDSLLFGTSQQLLQGVKLIYSSTLGAKVYAGDVEIKSGEGVVDLSSAKSVVARYNGALREYSVKAFVESADHSETSGAKVNTDMRVTGLPPFNSVSSAWFNGKLYILGAYYPNGTSATGDAFYELYESVDGAAWSKVSTNPAVVGGFGAVLLVKGDKMFAIGGSRMYGKDINGETADGWSINWRIMSTTDGVNWSDCTVNQVNAPTGRAFPQVCVHNNKIVLRRGKTVGFGMWQNVYQTDTYQSEDGVNWVRVKATPTTPTNRADDAMFSFGGKLWITGGYASYQSAGNVKADVWSSSDDGETWIQEEASGVQLNRYGHRVVSYSGRLYMIGGEYLDGNNRVGIKTVQESVDGINWTQLSQNYQLPPAFNGRIYPSVFMGEGNLVWIIGGYETSKGYYTIGGIDMPNRYDVWTKKIK